MSRKHRNRNQLPRQHQGQPQVQPPPDSVKERQLRTLRIEQLSARITFGPIPSANELLRYSEVQPDLPERIMRQFERRTEMADAQSEHRMKQESRVIGNNILMERLGWGSATVFGITALAGSLWLIHEGKSLVGFSGVVVSLAALLGLFLFSRRDQVQALAKKRVAEMVRDGVTPERLDVSPSRNARPIS